MNIAIFVLLLLFAIASLVSLARFARRIDAVYRFRKEMCDRVYATCMEDIRRGDGFLEERWEVLGVFSFEDMLNSSKPLRADVWYPNIEWMQDGVIHGTTSTITG